MVASTNSLCLRILRVRTARAYPGRDTTKGAAVGRTGMVISGVVLIALGVLFTLQGLGYVGGSAMSGSPTWAVLGPIIALVGVVLVVVGLRRPKVR